MTRLFVCSFFISLLLLFFTLNVSKVKFQSTMSLWFNVISTSKMFLIRTDSSSSTSFGQISFPVYSIGKRRTMVLIIDFGLLDSHVSYKFVYIYFVVVVVFFSLVKRKKFPDTHHVHIHSINIYNNPCMCIHVYYKGRGCMKLILRIEILSIAWHWILCAPFSTFSELDQRIKRKFDYLISVTKVKCFFSFFSSSYCVVYGILNVYVE